MGHDKSPGYLDFLTINDENRLRRENEMLKVRKDEIDQLRKEVAEYRSFQSHINPQIEAFQREINSLN